MTNAHVLMSRTLVGITALVGIVGVALPAGGSLRSQEKPTSVAVADAAPGSTPVDAGDDGFGWG